jgi:hypothetical protein
MKHIRITCISLMLAFGCAPKSGPETDKDEARQPLPVLCTVAPEYGVPLDSANLAIAYYHTYMKGLGKPYVQAFTISSMDFIEALGLPVAENDSVEFKHIRLYLGLDESSKEFKLYITPVVGASLKKDSVRAGKDHYLCQSSRNGSAILSEDGYMLDFALPCPNTCPE